MKIHKFQPQIYYYTFGPNEPVLRANVAATASPGPSDSRSESVWLEMKLNRGHRMD